MTSTDRRAPAIAARAAIALTLAALASPGCGSPDPYDRVAVEGTVTLDGAPLEDGTIGFVPQQEGAAARAPIVDGKFLLRRSEGLSPGPYRVEIYSFATTGRMVPSLDDPDQLMEERADVVPPRYNIRSDLTAEIPAGGSTGPLEFALSTGSAAR